MTHFSKCPQSGFRLALVLALILAWTAAPLRPVRPTTSSPPAATLT